MTVVSRDFAPGGVGFHGSSAFLGCSLVGRIYCYRFSPFSWFSLYHGSRLPAVPLGTCWGHVVFIRCFVRGYSSWSSSPCLWSRPKGSLLVPGPRGFLSSFSRPSLPSPLFVSLFLLLGILSSVLSLCLSVSFPPFPLPAAVFLPCPFSGGLDR